MLARGLYNRERDALKLSESKHFAFGHMAMGQSWYLPKNLIEKINKSQTYIIRLENIEIDLKHCIQRLKNRYSEYIDCPRNVSVQKLKNSQNFRSNFSFTKSKDFTQKERDAVLQHVSEDTVVNQIMTTQFLFDSE